MRVRTELVGTTSLILHNVQLADPDNQWTREIAKITSKKNKTEDDRKEIARLEWFGGLYLNREGRVAMPTANLRRCFQEAAKVKKAGKDVVRSVIPTTLDVPLVYDGPSDIKSLFQREEFVDGRMAGVQRGKVKRTRPIFHVWQLSADFELITTSLDYETFVGIVQDAGVIEGLGDNRINGFGRFSATVKVIGQ